MYVHVIYSIAVYNMTWTTKQKLPRDYSRVIFDLVVSATVQVRLSDQTLRI